MAQVGRLEREVSVGGEATVEVQYLITSVPPGRADAATLLGWLRGHWAIENRLNYVRDVTTGEDANRTRVGSGPQALAAIRNLAVSKLGGGEHRGGAATKLRPSSRAARKLAYPKELIDPSPTRPSSGKPPI